MAADQLALLGSTAPEAHQSTSCNLIQTKLQTDGHRFFSLCWCRFCSSNYSARGLTPFATTTRVTSIDYLQANPATLAQANALIKHNPTARLYDIFPKTGDLIPD
ncbi:hypothetical protein PGT21_032274 [Puccinia graminis f. sp. tritici]|uniref:Uncharacterized protein n=1 Tax=Puccinia graminis f. sp. tritici TaxID=56615 RepID=A0A5B0NC32_PUCGR|nr:hypothetical protein PGT21_032274 [Puccinia graminis f. sp. tritici]KAA1086346.1 hypothetical protein PGTUg99_015033 [Puccinia graminis f. sp. tritici]